MSETSIAPALTPREWKDTAFHRDGNDAFLSGQSLLANHSFADSNCAGVTFMGGRHALAALALYGQPFGFTWEDVDVIRAAREASMAEDRGYPEEQEEYRLLASLADRIAALLPPRVAPFLPIEVR